MKNLREFKASGENSETMDPVVKGDNHANRPLDKSNADPMPVLPGNEGEKPDMIANQSSGKKAPPRRADKVGGMKEMLNILAGMDAEQIAELRDSLVKPEDEITEAKVADLIKDDFDKLFEGTEFTEDFRGKAFAIFEAAVITKVQSEVDRLESEYDLRIDEEVKAFAEEQEERLNSYLDYAITEWMEENKLAIEEGMQNRINESFIEALKDVFEAHYFAVPEGKADMVEALANQVEELTNALNESENANLELMNAVKQKALEEVNEEVLVGLTDTQKDKIVSLSEGLEYSDVDEYETKLKALRDNYIAKPKDASKVTAELNEEFVSEENNSTIELDPYVKSVIDYTKRK